MILKKNVDIGKLSWIHRGGIASSYYEPETINEMCDLVKALNEKKEQYNVIGFTSNIYFKNTYNPANLISTKRLSSWNIENEFLKCQCGVKISTLSREMVNQGIKGFEGLVDLPGTVGAALYGNAGCYNCLLSDLVVKVEILCTDGVIRTYNREDLSFKTRSSALKRGEISGVILNVYLKLVKGDASELKALMASNIKSRKENQPSPENNLGTTYYNLKERTKLGLLIEKLGGGYSRILKIRGADAKQIKRHRLKFELSLAGGKNIVRYLFSINRFIWKDDNADKAFAEYQRIIAKLYKNPLLEIEIFE